MADLYAGTLPPFPGPPGGYVGPPLPSGNVPTPDSVGPAATVNYNPLESPILVLSSPYVEYWVLKIRRKKTGLRVTPVCGPVGTPADVTRDHAPFGSITVHFFSRRVGDIPLVPSEDMGDPNAILIESEVSAAGPSRFADGTPCMQISGRYYYELIVPYNESDVMTIAALPYTDDELGENTVGPANFSPTITGPNSPPAGAPTTPISF